MTIASEITRLQGAKSDIRQAIIEKGVDVGASLTIDQYAACIMAIETKPKPGYIDLLVVGGGGGTYWNQSQPWHGGNTGGGGGGGVKECMQEIISGESYSIVIGQGGTVYGDYNNDKRGGTSCFGEISASGGGGQSSNATYASGGMDGGGAGQGTSDYSSVSVRGGGKFCGGAGGSDSSAGGGGAGGDGGNATSSAGGVGGIGICSCISGQMHGYGGGGGGGGRYAGSQGIGTDGGGNGGLSCACMKGCDATYYGGGGGAGGGAGCQGVVILRYHTDGSDGVLPTSTGGTKYTCGEYTIHCFTSNGTFTPVYK